MSQYPYFHITYHGRYLLYLRTSPTYLPTYFLPMTTYRSNRRTEISTYRIAHGGNRTRNRVNLIDQYVDQYVTYQAN